jgi:hypothetical protein
MNAVRNNSVTEPRFFEALLTATVYAHVPVAQIPGRIRFVQFNHPDHGQPVLPFFSDAGKAERALGASRDISVIAMEARRLFELTRGATLMLDPNDHWATLYPEEIAALLAGKGLVAFGTERLAAPETVGVRAPTVPVEGLTQLLTAYCESEASVVAGYIIEILRGEEYQDASLLVALAAPSRVHERIVRAGMQFAQPAIDALSLPLLMTMIEPDGESSSFYKRGIQFYGRRGLTRGAGDMPG